MYITHVYIEIAYLVHIKITFVYIIMHLYISNYIFIYQVSLSYSTIMYHITFVYFRLRFSIQGNKTGKTSKLCSIWRSFVSKLYEFISLFKHFPSCDTNFMVLLGHIFPLSVCLCLLTVEHTNILLKESNRNMRLYAQQELRVSVVSGSSKLTLS